MAWNNDARKKYRLRPDVIARERQEVKVRWQKIKSDPVRLSVVNSKMREYRKTYIDPTTPQRKKELARNSYNRIRSDPSKLDQFQSRDRESHKRCLERKNREQINLLVIALSNPEFVRSVIEVSRETVPPRAIPKPRLYIRKSNRKSREPIVRDESWSKLSLAEKRKLSAREALERVKSDPDRLAKFREIAKAKAKAWREKDKGERRRVLFNSNPGYRISVLLRARIRLAMKDSGGKSGAKYEYLIGCTFPELRAHLESKWLPGMEWSCYGKGEGKWNADHIRPLASFPLHNEEERKKAFHYANLEPIWAVDNTRKSSVWNGRRWKHSDHQKELHA